MTVSGVMRRLVEMFGSGDVGDIDAVVAADRVAARSRWRGTRPDGTTVDRERIAIVRAAGVRAAEHRGDGVRP